MFIRLGKLLCDHVTKSKIDLYEKFKKTIDCLPMDGNADGMLLARRWQLRSLQLPSQSKPQQTLLLYPFFQVTVLVVTLVLVMLEVILISSLMPEQVLLQSRVRVILCVGARLVAEPRWRGNHWLIVAWL